MEESFEVDGGDSVRESIPHKSPSGLDIWMFPKIGGNPPKWMVKIMENPIKMDDLAVSLFLDTPI